MATEVERGSGTPVTNGTTWANTTNAVDGATGTNPATYATWTNATSGGTGYIEISGYNFASLVPADATLNSVTVTVRHLVNNTGRITSLQYQPYDGSTAIGTLTAGTLTTSAHDNSATFPVTLAQLRSANFKVRVNMVHAGNTQSLVVSIDHVDVTADYTPAAIPPWDGSIGGVGVTGVSGDWAYDTPAQTWTGSTATVGVAGVSGSFLPGDIVWTAPSLPGTVLAYNFDSTGTTEPDRTGNNNSAILQNNTTATDLHAAGELSLASNQHNLSYTPAVKPINAASVTIKIRSPAGTYARGSFWTLMNGLDTSGFNLCAHEAGSGAIYGIVRGASAAAVIVGPSGTITQGGVTHLALTYDGTTTRLYKNGTEIGSSTSASGNLNITGTDFRIGYHPLNPNAGFVAFFADDVRFFHRALSQPEIASLVDNPVSSDPGGNVATIGFSGVSGTWSAEEPTQVWTGSTATIGAAGVSGAFSAGPVTWVGSTATIGIAGTSGPFVAAPVTWVGSIATIGAAGTSGSFSPGAVTWVGSTATVGTSGVSGAFVPAPVTWSGSTATIGVAGVSGSFVAAAVTWTGSVGIVGVAGTSGAFSGGGTWGGSVATIGVVGVSGAFAGGPITWVGSVGMVGVAGVSGSFSSMFVWDGSVATIGVTGVSGVFTSAQTWAGSTAQIGVAGVSGNWTEIFGLVWIGTIAVVSVTGVSGVWGIWVRQAHHKPRRRFPRNRYLTPAKAYRLAHPEQFNFTINVSTYVPEPNPYTDRAWAKREIARRRLGINRLPAGKTAEELGRMGQDIDWRWIGTKGD